MRSLECAWAYGEELVAWAVSNYDDDGDGDEDADEK